MGTKGLLVCVCQGTCPSFKGMDIFEVVNRARREKLVDFAAIHPQLCADDGDAYLRQLLKDSSGLDHLYVAGCDPVMQRKMFGGAFADAGFDKVKFSGIEIRNLDTDHAYEAIRKVIQPDEPTKE
jgi:heterodisulfide reductase subunit A-like polyferredoxin